MHLATLAARVCINATSVAEGVPLCLCDHSKSRHVVLWSVPHPAATSTGPPEILHCVLGWHGQSQTVPLSTALVQLACPYSAVNGSTHDQ